MAVNFLKKSRLNVLEGRKSVLYLHPPSKTSVLRRASPLSDEFSGTLEEWHHVIAAGSKT
jgi:hypothetical protein